MALHTKKDFAKMCGMDTKKLSVYASPKRRKIVYSGELIDDNIEPNKSFLKKHKDLLATEKSDNKPPAAMTTKPAAPKLEKPTPPSGKQHKAKPPDTDGGLYELDKQKKSLELDKLEQEIEILKKKNEKLEGENYPTDLTKSLVAQVVKSLGSEYKDHTENFLIEISKRKSLSNEEMAEFRGLLIDGINKSSAKALSEAKREMKNTLKAFAAKKEVGERE